VRVQLWGTLMSIRPDGDICDGCGQLLKPGDHVVWEDNKPETRSGSFKLPTGTPVWHSRCAPPTEYSHPDPR